MLNASVIDKLESIKYSREGSTHGKRKEYGFKNSIEVIEGEKAMDDDDELKRTGGARKGSEINEQGRWSNVRNNSDSLWNKIGFRQADGEKEESGNSNKEKGGNCNFATNIDKNKNSSIYTLESS